jgi:hypothetical protein
MPLIRQLLPLAQNGLAARCRSSNGSGDAVFRALWRAQVSRTFAASVLGSVTIVFVSASA